MSIDDGTETDHGAHRSLLGRSYPATQDASALARMKDTPLTEDEIVRSVTSRNKSFFMLIQTGLEAKVRGALWDVDNEVVRTLYFYDHYESEVSIVSVTDVYARPPTIGKVKLQSTFGVSDQQEAIDVMMKHTHQELPQSPHKDVEHYLHYWMDRVCVCVRSAYASPSQ